MSNSALKSGILLCEYCCILFVCQNFCKYLQFDDIAKFKWNLNILFSRRDERYIRYFCICFQKFKIQVTKLTILKSLLF